MPANSSSSLGTKPIWGLLVSYSLPTIAAMIASSVYNIIDSAFIGHKVGTLALSAMAVTLPLMNISAAFGAMIGAGGSTLISIRLGQSDERAANHVLGNVVVLNVIMGLALTVLGLCFMDPILNLFGASASVKPFARQFMTVILLGNVFTHLYFGLNNALRSSGNPRKAMNMTLLTVAVNLLLAPVFIFVFEWGMVGAALATVISQMVALGCIVRHFLRPDQFLRFQRWAMRLRRGIVSGIFAIGISPFLLNMCACLVAIIINNRLGLFGGDAAIGAYGNVNKVLMLSAMVVLGINQGMQPIAGYNFGARQFSRVLGVLRYAVVLATGVMLVCFAAAELAPGLLMSVFTSDRELLSASVHALRITVLAMPVVGFQMVAATFFQSIGKAKLAAVLSTTRQMLMLVPLLFILPQVFHSPLNGIWFSMPISDVMSSALAAALLFFQLRKFRQMAAQCSGSASGPEGSSAATAPGNASASDGSSAGSL